MANIKSKNKTNIMNSTSISIINSQIKAIKTIKTRIIKRNKITFTITKAIDSEVLE